MNRQVTSKICLISLTRFYCFKVLFDIFYHQWGEETCFVQCIPRSSLCRGSFYRGFTVLLPQRDFWYHPPPPSPTSCLELKLSSLTFLERFYPLKTLTPPSQIFFLMTLLPYVQPHPTREFFCHSPFFGGLEGGVFSVGGCSHMALKLHGGVGMDIF